MCHTFAFGKKFLYVHQDDVALIFDTCYSLVSPAKVRLEKKKTSLSTLLNS